MEDFKKFLFIKKGLQLITADGYVDCIKRIERKIGIDPTNSQLEEYIYEIYNSDYSYSYKTNIALAIEHYTEFRNKPIKIGRQKKPQTIVKDTLTEAEVTTIIFNCKNLKEKAIICLLAYSGIRNRELTNLKVKDFDGGLNQIRINCGKNLKSGVSQISAGCSRIIQEYIRRNNLSDDDFMFKTYQNKQYTSGALRKRVKIISERARINKRVYPHLFRHSLATNLLIRGANLFTIKNQLRHVNIETTFNYINTIMLEEKNSYSKFEPCYL